MNAAELRPGDLVSVNGSVTWRVEEVTAITANKIHYRATYTRCDFLPGRIGTEAHYSHRLVTNLNVSR